MITSNSDSSGTPATTPSISSYCGLASRQVACMSSTAARDLVALVGEQRGVVEVRADSASSR